MLLLREEFDAEALVLFRIVDTSCDNILQNAKWLKGFRDTVFTIVAIFSAINTTLWILSKVQYFVANR